jgi:DNA-binding MarR family transcriptional regulator
MAPKPLARPRSRTEARRVDDYQRAIDAVRRIVRGLRVAAAETQSDAGVSGAQLFVLTQLRDKPAHSLSELGERTMTDRSSVATVVERLTERGFVTTQAAAEDRRRTVIQITAAGRALLRRAPQPPAARLVEGLSVFSKRDLAGLAAALERLVAGMGLAEEPAVMLFSDEDGARSTASGAKLRGT